MIMNSSELPTDCENFTDQSLSNITFADKNIEKIIKGLDPNEFRGHHLMSTCMLKNMRIFYLQTYTSYV